MDRTVLDDPLHPESFSDSLGAVPSGNFITLRPAAASESLPQSLLGT